MFQKHDKYKQKSLFSVEQQLNKRQQKLWSGSFEQHFFELIFRQIDESLFSVLFSQGYSRPNAPVNQLVSAMILMHRYGWSYSELQRQLNFNLLTRMALGIQELDEEIFCERTLFHFQYRLSEYYISTGINLLEAVFDGLSKDQLKRLNLKTSIQRGDSFLAASNITHYSRLQLLIEVLVRLHRILSDSDKALYAALFAPYIKQSSGRYIYGLDRGSLGKELAKLGPIYQRLYEQLQAQYSQQQAFEIFERVYQEHFTVAAEKIELRPNESLSSGSLQSPDDREASYRKKRNEESQGFSIHLSETAHPDNPIQLITDLEVAPNHVDDSQLLNKRLDKMKEKTPDLDEYHTDGGFGSEKNDEKMQELEIRHVQTAIRGRKAQVEIEIHSQEDPQTESQTYEVHCPQGQQIAAVATPKRFKAQFDASICARCPLKEMCPTKETRTGRTYYFTPEEARKHQRWRNIRELPPERQTIRPNVEATVRQMKNNMKNHKLKTRGIFKAILYTYFSAIATNAARIAQYKAELARISLATGRDSLFDRVWGLLQPNPSAQAVYNPIGSEFIPRSDHIETCRERDFFQETQHLLLKKPQIEKSTIAKE